MAGNDGTPFAFNEKAGFVEVARVVGLEVAKNNCPPAFLNVQ